MADTTQSVITQAIQKIKVYAPGVSVISADLLLLQNVMNQMLDGWSTETLACYANVETSFVLQVGVNAYTIGAGGVINTTRPISISTGPGAAYLKDSNNVRYPVNVIEQDQWNSITLLTVQSTLPDTLFYDPQYPLGIINVFPQPSSAYTMYFDSRIPFVDMTSLTQTFSLPPGYIDAIIDNLAVKAWPYFKQGDPPAKMVEDAGTSLGRVKRANLRQSPSIYDSAIVSKAQSSYNIYSDSVTNGRNM